VSVVAALEVEFAELAGRAPGLSAGALAAACFELGRQLDDPGNSATSKSMCAKSLQDILGQLRALAPPVLSSDGLDDIQAQRAKRRGVAARAKAAG
jgi:hypothetical protein